MFLSFSFQSYIEYAKIEDIVPYLQRASPIYATLFEGLTKQNYNQIKLNQGKNFKRQHCLSHGSHKWKYPNFYPAQHLQSNHFSPKKSKIKRKKVRNSVNGLKWAILKILNDQFFTKCFFCHMSNNNSNKRVLFSCFVYLK